MDGFNLSVAMNAIADAKPATLEVSAISPPPLAIQCSYLLSLPPELLLDILRRQWSASPARSTVEQASNRWAIRSICLTCKAFYGLVRPRLFSSLSMMTGEQLEEIIGWVQTADFDERSMVSSLRFEGLDASPGARGEISQERVAVLIASLPKLQRLYFGRFFTDTILPPLAQALRSLGTLETLAINMHEGGSTDGILGLLDCVRGLPRLRNVDVPSPIRCGITLQTADGPPIRELHVRQWHSEPASDWATIFGEASTVKCLHLGEANGRLDPCTRLPPSITALCFDEIGESTLQYDSKNITALSYRVRIVEGTPLYRPSQKLLLRHVKTLVLNLVLWPSARGTDEISLAHQDDVVTFLCDLCTLTLDHLVLIVSAAKPPKPESTPVERLIEKTMQGAAPRFKVTWGTIEQVDLMGLIGEIPAMRPLKWV